MVLPKFLLKAAFWLCFLTLITISFPRTWSLYSLGIWMFLGFIYWITSYRENIRELLSLKILILPLIIFFIVQLINIIIRKENIRCIESQLMFFLVPLLGFPLFRDRLFYKKNIFLFRAFIWGIFSVLVILVLLALICLNNRYNSEHNFFENLKINSKCFFSIDFSRFEHPSYLGVKIIWSIIIINLLLRQSLNKLIYGLIMSFFSIIIFLLASKAGIIMLTILFLWLLFSYINDKIKIVFYRYLIFLFIAIVLFISAFRIAREISRINIFINQLKSGFSQSEVNWKNLDQRTREWYCAIQLIKEKPIFGHGIEKVEDRMVEEYLKNRWEEEARFRYNAHNQFLETQMTYGIPGTLSLLWMLFTPLFFRKRLMYPKLATAFVFMMTFFLIFESMFVRQWGIMFFTLFYCILVIPSDVEDNLPVNHTALKNY